MDKGGEIKAEYREAFDLFDRNGDGVISIQELKTLLESLGQSPTDVEVQHIMQRLDKDQSGDVQFEAFYELMMEKHEQYEKMTLKDELMEIFREFDRNDDGLISISELRQVMNSVGEPLSDEELAAMIQVADTTQSGTVNFEQFKAIVGDLSTL